MRLPLTFGLALLTPLPVAAQGAPKPAAAARAYDPHDFQGVWTLASGGEYGPPATRGEVRYTVYPYTPEYQKLYDQRIQDEVDGKPFQTAGETCLPSGLGRMLTGGGPALEIFQNGDKVIVIKENGGIDRIYLKREHLNADDIGPLFYGDSIGRWEGDTLVVDTISLGGAPFLDGRAPHSDAATMVQRFRRIAADRLEIKVTVTDPKALTRPVTATAIHRLRPDYEMGEFYCTNQRDAHVPRQLTPSAK